MNVPQTEIDPYDFSWKNLSRITSTDNRAADITWPDTPAGQRMKELTERLPLVDPEIDAAAKRFAAKPQISEKVLERRERYAAEAEAEAEAKAIADTKAPVTKTTRKSIVATPFELRDPASLPERDWLFGRHYIRKYLTSTVGAGGGGKSAHAVSEALSMVTGRPLLDPEGPLTKTLRVWYVNAEDPQDEIDRRFHAAAKHFNVTAEHIGGRLYTDSGREQEFVIMRQEGRNLAVCQPLIDEMVAEIKRREIDVVIIDPLVSTHEVPENDNSAMQRVAKAWTEVADKANCCVEVIHHVVKSQNEVTADSARGGGALKDKTRGMRVINPMTASEAEKVGIEGPDGYFRIDQSKVNLVASGRSQWRRFASVPLGNGTISNKTGDEIGVVESWRWPSSSALAERVAETRRAAVADVPEDMLAGLKVRLHASHYKESAQAGNWAGKLVAEIFGLDPKTDREQIRAMLAGWIDAGELEIVDIMDAYRHLKPHIKPTAAL
ncbi:helicase RepA family protein [Mesorhizobium qingshengii]|uniref:Helicase RepA family protein n=1 Tax=Mesorhizobium qingshengii TaxID=1165689 RepID=A0ABT4R1B7_9HYPH|nr:AAA family ATPase [Mesorhizobium qingshengii]MCZ8547635.1 helicase RepA family protein [Mesorhizobium qingshengii]